MNEETIKHLEMIQGVINRMAHNSFILKSWSVALVAAIFALAAKEANQHYIWVAFFPAVALWSLDAYYVRQERLFRQLYESVRTRHSSPNQVSPFSMDTRPYASAVQGLLRTLFSITVIGLHGTIVLVVAMAGVVINIKKILC